MFRVRFRYLAVVSNYLRYTDCFREERFAANLYFCSNSGIVSRLFDCCDFVVVEISEGRSRFLWVYKLSIDRLRDELSQRGLDSEGSVGPVAAAAASGCVVRDCALFL